MTRSVAWLTPFSTASDVSAFSRNLLVEFESSAQRLGASPSILINENGPSYWSRLPQIPLAGSNIDLEIVSSFDFCIYNIGNNQENHGNINRLALKIPGIVVVHDIAMQHYFAGYFFETRRRKDIYAQVMAEYYASVGLNAISLSQICSMVTNPVYAPWDTQHVTQFPIIEPFVKTAAAIVVHSSFAEELIRPLTPVPILRLQLPWDQKPYISERELKDWRKETRKDRVRTILYFGHIGRAKCIDVVIEAFGRSERLCEQARLVIAGFPGDTQYVEELQAAVSALGLKSHVHFEFSISDERLLALKREADIFVNLRFPNTESASGSLVEQMNSGKPVLIYPTGSFAEVDGDAAVAIPREGGVQAVILALERLVSEPEQRISVGQRGLQFVRRIGRTEYIQKLWDFMLDNEDLLRRRKSCSVSRRLGHRHPDTVTADEQWLKGVSDARRLFSLAETPRYVVDVRIFERWTPDIIARCVSTGLFGQLPNSRLERVVLQLIAKYPRARLYRALLRAHALWLFLCGDHDMVSKQRLLLATPMLEPVAWTMLTCLGSQVFANSCYIFLLGRLPYAGEAEKCAGNVASHSSSKIIRDFLVSKEFAGRRVPATCLRPLQDWMDQTEQLQVLFPKLPANGVAAFCSEAPDVANYLVRGWHEPEGDGVWSNVPRSAIRFRWPFASKRTGQTNLFLRGRLAMPDGAANRRFQVSCNDALVYTTTVSEETWFTFEVRLPFFEGEGDNFLIEFDCQETVNFASLGAGSDTRNLGFLLADIRLSDNP